MGSNDFTIRYARKQELPTVATMMIALHDPENLISDRTQPFELAYGDEVHEYAVQLQKDTERRLGRLLVASQGGELLGFVQYGLTRERLADGGNGKWARWTTTREVDGVPPGATGYIAELYVKESARGSQVGRSLVGVAALEIATAGVAEVDLQILPAHAPAAMPFYEGLGFFEQPPLPGETALPVLTLTLTPEVQQRFLAEAVARTGISLAV